jgi:hypothetical protein
MRPPLNPTPELVAWIEDQDPDWSQPDEVIATSLNALTARNPLPRDSFPKPFTVPEVFALLSKASMKNLSKLHYVPDVRDKISANDREACGHYFELLFQSANITQSEYKAVVSLLAATVPDPGWTISVPETVANFGRPLDPDDVAAARPQGLS